LFKKPQAEYIPVTGLLQALFTEKALPKRERKNESVTLQGLSELIFQPM
jgi:hypothetical protein